MAKLALCMKASNAPVEIQSIRKNKDRAILTSNAAIIAIINQTDISMQDRATCETDPSFLQFIPYIAVVSPSGKVFNYSRGGSGGEERLVSKMSIGLGGHVDSMPPAGVSLIDHLRAEAARELKEEIGLDIEAADPALTIEAILVDATTPVDQVHIGIFCTYRLQSDDGAGLNFEEGVIEKGEFSTTHNLTQSGKHARMENWSKLALDILPSLIG
jgi:predicted NUDIX family phosphoesterase